MQVRKPVTSIGPGTGAVFLSRLVILPSSAGRPGDDHLVDDVILPLPG